MLGISSIGCYIPKKSASNLDLISEFQFDDVFLKSKIGVLSRPVKDETEETSDLCLMAFNDLLKKDSSLDKESIECVILITQNPDSNIPHTSAIFHQKAELNDNCACFDISLGCSGYVYGLSVIKSFMESNGLKKGILLTADPYSKIIDPKDKNTSLIFGDAATATLISDDYMYKPNRFSFGTHGKKSGSLKTVENKLFMDGRDIFNFTASKIPTDTLKCLSDNNKDITDIDHFIFHPGSKFILDTLIKRLELDPGKVSSDILMTGNTVSSSIPLFLSKVIDHNFDNIFISGFGVGLSWSSTVLTRKR